MNLEYWKGNWERAALIFVGVIALIQPVAYFGGYFAVFLCLLPFAAFCIIRFDWVKQKTWQLMGAIGEARQRLKNTGQGVIVSPHVQLQPAPTGGTEERTKPMHRALGGLYVIIASVSWLTVSGLLAVIFLWPSARGYEVAGWSLIELLRAFGFVASGVLIWSNMNSARWAPRGLRSLDLWSTRVGLMLLCIIMLVHFFRPEARQGVAIADHAFLLGVFVFGVYDFFANIRDQLRSRTMLAEEANLAAQAALAAPPLPQPMSQTGPFISFVDVLGVGARIAVPNGVAAFIELDADGYVQSDLDLGYPQILAILSAAANRTVTTVAA